MRKCFMMVVLMLVLVPGFVVHAEGTTQDYTINDLNMTVSLNQDWYTLTKDTTLSAEQIELLGMSQTEFEQYFTNNQIDLYSMSDSFDFFIRSNDSDINNLSNYSNQDIQSLADEIAKNTSSLEYQLWKNQGLTYIESSYYDSINSLYIYEFYTVVNRKNITFTAQKLTEFTDEEETEIKNIMENVKIEVLDQYKNEESGLAIEMTPLLSGFLIVGGVVCVGIIILLTRKKH